MEKKDSSVKPERIQDQKSTVGGAEFKSDIMVQDQA